MNDWNIREVQDNMDGLALVSRDIVNLVSLLCAEFEEAEYILVWELVEDNDSVGRSVVQFHVSSQLFNTEGLNSPRYATSFPLTIIFAILPLMKELWVVSSTE